MLHMQLNGVVTSCWFSIFTPGFYDLYEVLTKE